MMIRGQPRPDRRTGLAGLDRDFDIGQLQVRGTEHVRQQRADARLAALRSEERAIGGDEVRPLGRPWNHRQRFTLVVLNGEHPARLERTRELAHVIVRLGQKQEHPAGENQIV
jgi:hypothetical protein